MGLLMSDFTALDQPARERLLAQLAPAGFYSSGEDTLVVTAFCKLSGVTLAVRYRAIDLDGRPVTSGDNFAPTSNRLATTLTIRLPIGWIYSVDIFATAGLPRMGDCYVTVDVVRGESAAGTVQQTLVQNYVTTSYKLAWPGSTSISPLDGVGSLRVIVGSTPAPGADIAEQAATSARFQILAFQSRLVCGIGVANRQPELTIDDGANEYYRAPSLAAIPASTTIRITWAPGMTNQISTSAAPGSWIVTLGDQLYVPPGGRVRTLTQGIQAADQWDAPRYLVNDWIDLS